MTYETIKMSIDTRGVATLMLARPQVHNAMNGVMWRELLDAVQALEADGSVRVVVLTGEGQTFCAGGDLGYQQAQGGASLDDRLDEARRFSALLHALDSLSKPLIGRINGAAYAGGFSLISVTDVAIGIDTASFAITEARLGLVPAVMLPFVVRRLGMVNARRLFLTARRFPAAEAVSYGLLHASVPPGALDAAVEDEVAHVLRCGPQALRTIKHLIAQASRHGIDVPHEHTIGQVAAMWDSAEGREGILSYFEKRKPAWTTPA
ncbi:enoyl-CoA hydratase [Vineibacter terrae]|uniref:Enoyl-CoA hydratase n=1 Tax=Vineibacter terrae TaxID=2586908 RepID=A0A5C8P9V5_9HYPH|nr:enoyl-CoA hydratase-related protein [Vineibacter terrae]TXL70328.1 enoyl-CoA hydratase [Vineibacter terrae]